MPTAASKAKSTAAPKKSAPVATSRATAKSTAKGKRPVPARRPQQMQPALERYKEIQQALADKGYFAGPVDGMWGPESVEALKRFQKEQNLDVDGKLGALSLMALGLGPKRGASQAENPVPPGAKSEPVDPPPIAQPEPVDRPAEETPRQ